VNNKFDELTKSLAQSGTRRAALKKFGVGFAAITLAAFGLANKAEADSPTGTCHPPVMAVSATPIAAAVFALTPKKGVRQRE